MPQPTRSTQPTRPTRRLLITSVLACLLLVGGCSTDSTGPERVRGSLRPDSGDSDHVSKAEDEVGQDDDATPQEVFAAGSPETMSVRPDGSLITTYLARSDTEGEGPSQTAWRAFDARGHRLAQGRGDNVQAVSDGFLVADAAVDSLTSATHIDPDGEVVEVATTDKRFFPRRGDTLVGSLSAFYRPSTRKLFASPAPTQVAYAGPGPGANVALSDTGVLYFRTDPPKAPLPVAATSDGGRTWRVAQVRTGGFLPNLIAAQGDVAAIAFGKSVDAGSGFAGLAVTRDAGRTWQRLGRGAGLPSGVYIGSLDVGDDGRVLVGGFGTGWWRATSAAGTSYEQLPLPPGGVSDVEATSGHLVALSDRGLWSSTDDGRHWTRLDVEGS